MISIDTSFAREFLKTGPDTNGAAEALKNLLSGNCPGNQFLGWTKLPADRCDGEFGRICSAGREIYENAEVLVVIGIGGSYLGARAALEFLLSPRYNEILRKGPKIYFAGNGISGEEIEQILQLAGGRSLYLNVISKSGTTLEPAIAFRVFRKYLEETYGKAEAAKRIICTTDKAKGALKNMADAEGYRTFIVPDDVGGRYSVLTPVGLLPMAAAGIDINLLRDKAGEAAKIYLSDAPGNPALSYAAMRQALYTQAGKKLEILSCPSESVRFLAEWWKQLFGESEGKDGKGIFPASCVYTADLHSMGQYIQDGERMLFETMLSFEKSGSSLKVPYSETDGDGLNYTAGKTFSEIYGCAAEGVCRAHRDGGVPVIRISCPRQDEEGLAHLIVFFEAACAVSGLMEGVNPFNQPGVEEYKKNMFALLGKK